MMNYFSSKKKWMAYLILLTFVFTCIVPTNLAGGNSAWADTAASAPMAATAENTIVSAGVESGITFKMFDYDKNINWSDGTSGTFRPIASYFTFRGSEGNVSEGEQPKMPTFVQYTYQEGETVKEVKTNINNLYDEDGFTLNHATVERTLDENGYPVLDLSRYANGTPRTSYPDVSEENLKLDYLFKAGDHAVSAYTANNTLLKYNEATGEYSYNSKDNAVDFDRDTGNFLVRNYKERSKSTTNYENSSPYWDFLPFTYSTTGSADKTNRDKIETNEKDSEGNVIMKNAVGYGLPYNYDTNPNYWYGMTMETQFRQPASGKVENGSDMVFSFSGDDDVWVFIDNVLVLDLGGTHGVVTGSINFADGTVTQHIDWAGDNGTKLYHWNATKNQTEACVTTGENACSGCGGYVKSYPPTTIKACFDAAGQTNTVNWKDDTFADNTKHTLKFFYLERGSGSANCAMNFNLQVSETAKTVEKVWDDDNNRDGIRPDSVQVQLFKDGQPTTGSAITLDVTNNWAYTWTELEKYDDNGNEINYTVKELEQGSSDKYLEAGAAFNEDYNVTYATDTTTGKVTVTNTHEPETINISGKKIWVDENTDKRKDITIRLFDAKYPDQEIRHTVITTNDPLEFTFNGLPKYRTGSVGEKISYVVTEDKVDGYQTIYDINSYDITNIRDDNPALLTDLPVKKIWDDDGNTQGKRPSSITLQLLVNGKTTGSAIEFKPSDSSANEWSYTFTDLPRYGEGGITNVYTVEEINVPEGYISSMAATMNGVSITNKLFDGNIGEFGVSKEVKDLDGNVLATDKDFTFNLEVNAETAKWTALLVSQRDALLDEKSAAESRVNETDNALKNAVKLFEEHTHVYTTTSAYDFVMTSTPSHYRYTIVDNTGDVFSKTTSSAYDFWGNASEITGDGKDGIVTKIIEAVKELAKQFERLTNPASFLQKLWAKVEKDIHDDASVAMDEEITEELLIAARNYDDAEKQLNVIKDEIEIFNKNIPTTPGAITLVMKADNGTEKTLDLSPEASNKYFDGKVYTIPFMLKNGEDMRFAMKTTTGTAVSYVVKEVLTDDVKNINGYNYQYTDINNVRTLETTTQNLTKDTEFKGFWFINWYDKPDDPWTPTTPDPKDPPPPPEKTNPDTTIPDENIPTGSVEPGEPLDELEDPEIPLGDAPATGDTNNVAPFMALLLAAIAGLVITRRKFN